MHLLTKDQREKPVQSAPPDLKRPSQRADAPTRAFFLSFICALGSPSVHLIRTPQALRHVVGAKRAASPLLQTFQR